MARFDLNQLVGRRRSDRLLAPGPAERDWLGFGQRLPGLGRIRFDHLQAGAGQDFLRVRAWRFLARCLVAGHFLAGRFNPRRFVGRRLLARGFRPGSFSVDRLLGARRGRRLGLPGRRVVLLRHLGFALLLQAMLFQLLRIDRLVRALHVGIVTTGLLRARLFLARLAFRAALAAIRTITSTAATAATAATATTSAAMLFTFLLWRTRSVRRCCLRAPWRLGLLRRARRALVGPALALRAVAVRTLHLAEFSLLRHFRLLALALRAIRPRLLLLLRTWFAGLRLIAARLITATVTSITSAAAIALVIALAFATTVASAAAITAATSTTFAAATLVPVAVLVARTLFARRPCRTHRGFIGGRRLVGLLLGLQPAEEAAEES